MVETVSPLAQEAVPGRHGPIGPDGPGITLSEERIGALWQVAAWPDRLSSAADAAAHAAGAAAPPGPGRSTEGTAARLLRTEPLKVWLLSAGPLPRPALDPADGAATDLSHARVLIRVAGRDRAALMARLVPLDLRPAAFPDGAVAATGLHQVGVCLCCRTEGFDLLVPRSFARSLWEHLLSSAVQFGVETG